MRTILIAAAASLSLAACATPQPYGPATSPTSQGWTLLPIENDRWRVSYRGLGPPELIRDYAMLRAADLTLERGGTWFEVYRESIDAGYPGGARPSVGVGAGSSRWGGYRSSGVGVGVGVNLSGGEPTTILLEIRIGQGPRPDDRDAYDAAEVARIIRERM